MNIRAYQPTDEAAVVDLWRRCELLRPQNDPLADIQRKLSVSPDLFLVGVLNAELIAACMAGYDGHRGSIYYFAVAPERQKSGYGKQLMDRAETLLRERGCPKINLLVRTTNWQVIEFYERLGFNLDEVVSLGKRLIPDGAPA